MIPYPNQREVCESSLRETFAIPFPIYQFSLVPQVLRLEFVVRPVLNSIFQDQLFILRCIMLD